MRAGLAAHTVHVPDTWGGWRVHAAQATAGVGLTSIEHAARVDAMIRDAVDRCGKYLTPAVRTALHERWLAEAAEWRELVRERAGYRNASWMWRALGLATRIGTGSRAAREYALARLLARPGTGWVRRRLQHVETAPVLLPAEETGERVSVPQAALLARSVDGI
jgi:hypothetical protein